MDAYETETFTTTDVTELRQLGEALYARVDLLTAKQRFNPVHGVPYELNACRAMLGRVSECIDNVEKHWKEKCR